MLSINGNKNFSTINTNELKNSIGKSISIHGVIYKIRQMNGFAFILLNTHRSLVQCVYTEDLLKSSTVDLKENMCVVITGDVSEEKRSALGYEIIVERVKILSTPEEQAPVVLNKDCVTASMKTLLDYRPITLRNIKQKAIFKIQEGICRGFRDFLYRNEFTEIHTPKIVASGAEGGANIFSVDYFGKRAYLAQSPQFYKQMMIGVFERVFEIAPVFRAEMHNTTRHLNEYTSVDLEMGFIENFMQLMSLETKMISETLLFLSENYSDELSLLKVNIPSVTDIPALKFTEAKELVANTYQRKITDFEDFEPEEERLLCKLLKQQTGSDFVFVTHYKSSKRPFYTKDSADNPEYTDSFDLLFRGVEVTTGGQRIHNYQEQINKMKARNMKIELFDSYLMAHKYGLPPHGGLGIGLERFTARLLELPNIRCAALFPRDIERLEP